MPKVRPEISEDLIFKVKLTYPQETAMLGNAETVEWAIKKAIACKNNGENKTVGEKSNDRP